MIPRDTVSTCAACGFTSKPTTKALAARALTLHSCERHQRLAARRAVGDRRRELRGTVVRECEHKYAAHQHGTNAAYHLDNCRCLPCSTAAVAYDRARTRQSAYGRWQPYVDAEPARQHVRALMAAGVGWKRIGQHVGLSGGTMSKLLYGTPQHGPSKRIRPETARRLLAVAAADVLAAGARVPAAETWRHVHGLIALGYTKAWIGREIGQHRGALQLGSTFVLAGTARAVAALADRTGDTSGPSARARALAARHGWLTPMQQYAASLGDLDEQRTKRSRAEVLIEDARWLLDGGLSVDLTASRLGVSAEYIRNLLAGTKGRRAS